MCPRRSVRRRMGVAMAEPPGMTESEPGVSFGARLQRAREAAGLSQEDLAARAALSPNAVGALERGARRHPNPATVRALAVALAMTDAERAALVASVPRRGQTPADEPTSVRNVPASLSPLIGREAEVGAVSTLLRGDEIRLVTLTGPGGVGKSRLALQVADRLRVEFDDGICFVALDPIRDPGLLTATIAESLGLREMGGRPLTERLIDYLRKRRLLLILDNVEHLLAAAPDISRLLIACPWLKVMATSRVILRLTGEHAFPVPPLPYPGLAGSSIGSTAANYDAVRLFLARAQAANPSFEPSPAHLAAIGTLCARLDGLPLAIELAAARVGHLPLPTLVERLERSLPLLTGGPRDAPARLRTMRAAIAWSHELLDGDEQRQFRRLAVFRGGFDLHAAEAIVRGFGHPDDDILDLIASLIDKSLVQFEAREEPRYRMLETVREYAWDQLVACGEIAAARRAHALHFLALAERAAPEWWGANPGAWLDRLEAERDNLRVALGWAIEHRDIEIGPRLAIALHWLWRIRGPVREGLGWMEAVLDHADATPPALRAALLTRAGDLAMVQGDIARAVDLHDASLAVARSLEEPWGLMFALGWRGLTALHQGELGHAEEFLEEARALSRVVGPSIWDAAAPDVLASVARHRGEQARAAALLEEALTVCQRGQVTWCTADVLTHLGDLASDRGDFDQADALYRRGLAMHWQTGERRDFAGGLSGFAFTVAARGNPEQAARLCGVVHTLMDAAGVNLPPSGQTNYDRTLAAIRAALGEAASAAALAAGRALPPDRVVADIAAAPTPSTEIDDGIEVADAADLFGLTRRERDVLALLPGRTSREIAVLLSLSPRTVEHHVDSVLSKLGVRSRSAATALASRYGLV
jgi:predicted ATPase/DNA-binding CsgD family transcriptional regulator/DNA-binding XRE family transcriptional regulator